MTSENFKQESRNLREQLQALSANGFEINYVDDDGEDHYVKTIDEAMDHIDGVDYSVVHFKPAGTLVIVRGNMPWEVINDHSENLTPFIIDFE